MVTGLMLIKKNIDGVIAFQALSFVKGSLEKNFCF